jgi:hypothetical protein
LDLKNDSYGLMIWILKSPRRFLGFGLKTKHALVYQLRLKTDGRVTTWDMYQDLAAYFAWKQVGLGFLSLASRLAEARRRVVHVTPSQKLYRSQVEDGWVDAMNYIGPCYPCFAVFILLDHRSITIF